MQVLFAMSTSSTAWSEGADQKNMLLFICAHNFHGHVICWQHHKSFQSHVCAVTGLAGTTRSKDKGQGREERWTGRLQQRNGSQEPVNARQKSRQQSSNAQLQRYRFSLEPCPSPVFFSWFVEASLRDEDFEMAVYIEYELRSYFGFFKLARACETILRSYAYDGVTNCVKYNSKAIAQSL